MAAPRTTVARAGAVALAAGAVTLSSLTMTGAAAHAAAPAPAAKVTATIRLVAGGGSVTGVLKSSKGSCRKQRTVSLLWKDVGASKFIKVEEDASNNQGVWRVPGPGGDIPAGRYYVTVPAGNGCKAARSATIAVS